MHIIKIHFEKYRFTKMPVFDLGSFLAPHREGSQTLDRALQWGLNATIDNISTALRAPIERLLAA